MTYEPYPVQPDPYTSGSYPPPPPAPQGKGFGIASMIVGIVAILLAFIPIIGLVSFVLGLVAIGLGIFAVITMFAVANTALINMLMASRLVYGMSREGILPGILGKVHRSRRSPYVAIAFTTLLAVALVTFVGAIPALAGTTALLLLCVFTVTNIAVLVVRRDSVKHKHFRTPTLLPVLGALTCAFLVGPWTGRDPGQYLIAGILIAIGIALWLATAVFHRRTDREN